MQTFHPRSCAYPEHTYLGFGKGAPRTCWKACRAVSSLASLALKYMLGEAKTMPLMCSFADHIERSF